MPSTTTFDALPARSRVWVFTSSRELTAEDRSRLDALMDKVFGVWAHKAPGARGCHELREGRFLVVGADETAECLSGCSVDAMVAWLKKLEEESGLVLVDRLAVFYRDASGGIQRVLRPDFRRLVESGEVTAGTPVFDPTVSRVEDLREGRFELPFADAWHARMFASPGAPAR